MKHVNAKDVFPPPLVKEIQKHYSGGYLLIPKPRRKRYEKKAQPKGKAEQMRGGK